MRDTQYATIFESISDEIPSAPAVAHGRVNRTWQEFDDRAARIASALGEAGLSRESKVAIYLYNGNEYLEVVYAACKIRAVPVNVNYRYLEKELEYLLTNSDAEALVFDSAFDERVANLRTTLGKSIKAWIRVGEKDNSPHGEAVWLYEDLIDSSDPAARMERSSDDYMLNYTGGTTGLPKGALGPAGMINMTESGFGPMPNLGVPAFADPVVLARELRDAGGSLVTVPASPLMHGQGLNACLATLSVGGRAVTLESRSFDPTELFRVVEETGVTSVAIVGDAFAKPMLSTLQAAAQNGRGFKTSSLRTILSGGLAWSAEVKHGLLEHMPTVTLFDAYGSSEGLIGFRMTRGGERASTTNFIPTPGLKVLRENGDEIQPGSGEAGRIAAPTIVRGYYKDPVKTAEVFKVVDGVRYAMAGDWGVIEADGSVTLLGRDSSIINTGGEKVFAEEVEAVITSMPGVADCLVLGVPHPRFGQQVAALVTVSAGHELSDVDITDTIRANLASYKAPRMVQFLPSIPRFPSGKADYREARRIATDNVTESSQRGDGDGGEG